MRPLLTRSATLAVTLLVIVGAGLAQAGSGGHRRIVAHGESPEGLEWTIRAEQTRHLINVTFDVESASESYGWGLAFEPPIPDGAFMAVSGSDLGPANEGDLSGVTERGVVVLRVRMNEGPRLAIDPQLAPKPVRERHPWARHLRFFDVFFADGFSPQGVRALDAEGNSVGHSRSHGGAFYSWAEGISSP